jgi:transcriptional regulator with XRE-family HTH domain
VHREALAGYLRALRRERGLTLEEAGRATGISSSFLSLVEQGRSDITIGRLIRLAEFYEVDLADLVAGGRSEPATHVHILRTDGATALHSEQERVDLYDLSGGSHWALIPMMGIHAPGGGVEVDDPDERETMLFVLEGTFSLEFANEPPVRLERGEGAIYRSTSTYRFTNVDDVTGRVLAIGIDPKRTRETPPTPQQE